MMQHPGADKPVQAVAKVRQHQIVHQREAFREFMKANRLAPTVWAKKAGVPAPLLLGYLTGSAELDAATAAKLARAAGVKPAQLFAAKEKAAPRPPFQSKIDPGS